MNKLADNSSLNKSVPVYTLSVASGLAEIPSHSIMQYINKGLIIPFKKDSSRNLFSDVDISRLKHIRYQLETLGLNIACIKSLLALVPCWAIRECSDEDRVICEAYQSSTQPCWEASKKGTKCKNSDCRQCDVYILPETYSDLKVLYQRFIPGP